MLLIGSVSVSAYSNDASYNQVHKNSLGNVLTSYTVGMHWYYDGSHVTGHDTPWYQYGGFIGWYETSHSEPVYTASDSSYYQIDGHAHYCFFYCVFQDNIYLTIWTYSNGLSTYQAT